MKKEIYSAQTHAYSASVHEEILKNSQIYTQKKEIAGPVINLFYHELKDQAPKMRRVLDIVFGSLTYILYLFLTPLILLYLKLSGVNSPYWHFTGVGQYGNPINVKIFNIGYYHIVDDVSTNEEIPPFHFLYKTNLFKLPLITEVLKGNISLVGPQLLEEKYALDLINNYTDFHKRFAPKPGLFSPACYYRYKKQQNDYSDELQKDLEYACEQTLNTYFKSL